METQPSNVYGGYGYQNQNVLQGIDLLSGTFDVGIDGDLLIAGLAAAAAAFFFFVYAAITTGRKKRDVESSGIFPEWFSGTKSEGMTVPKIHWQ